jgi:hypothetical protein
LTKDINHSGILVKQAELIIPRLEKITPDSSWAHKASGCRGSLIRLLELKGEYDGSRKVARDVSIPLNDDDFIVLKNVLERSYEILEGAAAERLR